MGQFIQSFFLRKIFLQTGEARGSKKIFTSVSTKTDNLEKSFSIKINFPERSILIFSFEAVIQQ
ncbi:hypothetical protein CNR22_21355 [Sphingobacteriaceae bacterium]|nr:hypothetical protein CNR22_21355 [Sphingobacteriaceae bacterium]